MSEKQLWCAVIQQAVIDATEPLSTKFKWRRIEQLNARDWLTKPNKDFTVVCNLAGLEPMRLRSYAADLVAKAAQHDQPLTTDAPRRRRTSRNTECQSAA
ncbi:hypothetical protein [Bradyrhizobium sp. cf659]|uniref:hypothetical protein n=1 Tax=Bradyrhizobium sp. cf659 TaxID=1761771 RepID=UPI0008E33EF9|nr:hypothetical protein [Bradyrhizobium sp. cf659]SFH83473.1 hypothetical protein SAMN04487925_101705 [Bradyrhizobium sp. cf659]